MSKQTSEVNNNQANTGLIQIITGPMFSGKTEGLIALLTNEMDRGKKVICIKPAIDDRYHKHKVISHDKNHFPAIAVDTNMGIFELSLENEVIGIDEAQFFHESIVDEVTKLANMGKKIIISGLNLDYKGLPFTTLAHLMAIAQQVEIKQGQCVQCNNPSTHTSRKETITAKRIVIGGKELYEPRCRKCFIESNN